MRKIEVLYKDSGTFGVPIKLNSELIRRFEQCSALGLTPTLMVRNGQMAIKLSDDEVYPCDESPDLKWDIYMRSNEMMRLVGRGSKKYTVSREKKTGAILWQASAESNTKKKVSEKQSPVRKVAEEPKFAQDPSKLPFKIKPQDTKKDIRNKFLALLSLGPIDKSHIVEFTDIDEAEVDSLLSLHAQLYDSASFVSGDKFSRSILKTEGNGAYILKDKSYKELQPVSWPWYTRDERQVVISNVQNALTRLGYSESHPLRKIICEGQEHPSSVNKKSSLGGGLLKNRNTKSPFMRSQTDSPHISEQKQQKVISPAKAHKKRPSTSERDSSFRKRQTSSDSSNSSSFNDEEDTKYNAVDADIEPEKIKKSASTTSEMSKDSLQTSKTFQYYCDLASKFKQRYKEYEELYRCLNSATKGNSDEKKDLQRLFQLHNMLTEWKKKLWDFDNRIKSKSAIMNLSKHKKLGISKSANSTPLSGDRPNFSDLRTEPNENSRIFNSTNHISNPQKKFSQGSLGSQGSDTLKNIKPLKGLLDY